MKKILILQLIGCLIFTGFILLFNGAGLFNPMTVILIYWTMGLCNVINAKWIITKPIEDIGTHDNLTGLLNREGLNQNIPKYEKHKEYTVIFYDLDNLKKINDCYGHDDGDLILKYATERLRYWEIYGDVYRIGGDEFLVVISNELSKEKLTYLINGFDNSPLNYEFDNDFKCIFSYGYAIKSKSIKKSFNTVMNEADEKMYQMKHKTHHPEV